ncbi:ABC transporter substrate-binding protein [Microbacteriaceae bacterium K1510]|nr:ABC transporter substrate-binding protein [Microbacteriaceae bacterium K1510]
MMKHLVLGLVGASLIASAAAAQTVKIGVVEPLTGGVAFDGNNVVKGARLAAKEINAAGGVLGNQVELVIADGACKPAESVSAAEKLIAADKVPVIMGAFCSGATQAVMPLAEKSQIPLVTGVSSLPRLTEVGNRWFFRNAETDAMMAAAFAKSLHNDLKFNSVFFLAANDDWGRGTVDSFKKILEGIGAKVVGAEYFEYSHADFYTPLTKVRAAKPDLVVVVAETQAASILVKQAKELGLNSKIFGVGAWATPTFINLAGPAADGLLAGVAYASTIAGDLNKVFVDKFKAEYNEAPGKYSMSGYNTIHIIAQAIKRAGAAEPAKIRDALTATDYTGPTGRLRFDDKGQVYGQDVFLVELQGGSPLVKASAKMEKPN